MSQRYIDLSFEESNQSMLDGGFQMENDATVIRLRVLNASAKHYIEIERLNAKHDKYRSAELPVVDGYATLELSRDYTNSTIYVQGVMKVDDICRKTPRMRLGFKRSINAIEELPESQPSWADSVESRLDELKDGLTPDSVLYTKQELNDTQKQQARENIGTMPKLFYKQGEEIARVVEIDDSETLGFKDVILFSDVNYCIDGVGRFCVVENSTDKTATVKNGTFATYKFSIDVLSSKQLFAGVWLFTLAFQQQFVDKDVLKVGASLFCIENDVSIPKSVLSESVVLSSYHADKTPSYINWVCRDGNNEGFVHKDVIYISNSTALAERLQANNTGCIIICDYNDSIIDILFVTNSKHPSHSTAQLTYGVGCKDGAWGTYYAAVNNMEVAWYVETFTPYPSDPSLGITAATVGQTIRVKAVDDTGKPTEWEAVDQRYTLSVTVNTQDGVTVTGQTVTVRAGDADGAVFGTAAYNGQTVSFNVPDGFAYYVEVTDDLAAHFKPSVAKGVINGASASVTLLYNDFSTIKTAPDIKAALDADMDLTELVGQQITCQRSGATLAWDVVDYNATDKVVTLLMHDLLPDDMQFEPSQALAYFPDGLAAGAYSFVSGNNTYYFTLTKAIPAGGQLRATETTFDAYASQTTFAVTENGTVSTTAIDGATSLGKSGEGALNNMDRVKYGSNNFGESGLRQWLNSSAAAGETMPQITKFQRPYAPNRPGFMAGLDADFVASVADTTWPCSANTTYECPADMGGITVKGASYTVTNRFALASEKELFGSYDGVPAGDAVFDLYQDADNTDRIKYYNNTARSWWVRSPTRIGANVVHGVSTTGAGGNLGALHSYGVAVACKIAKSS